MTRYPHYLQAIWSHAFACAWKFLGSSPVRWAQTFVAGLGSALVILVLIGPWLKHHAIDIGDHLPEKAFLTTVAASIFTILAIPALTLFLGLTYSPYAVWRVAERTAAELSKKAGHDPEKFAAAATAFRELTPLNQELERRFYEVRSWLTSDGKRGEIPILGDVQLTAALDDAAAAIGPLTANACSRLRQSWEIARSWENRERSNYADRELAEYARGWVANQLLDMHALTNAAFQEAGANVRLSRGVDPEELREAARRVNGSPS